MNEDCSQEVLQAIEAICERLTDRTTSLFLGAGINHGIKTNDGKSFPLGGDLADRISKDLLDINDSTLSLGESAEMARHRIGDSEFNSYLHEIFSSFEPSTTHISLLTLPWDAIYTTNYDTLLEKARKVSATAYHKSIQPIFSNQVDLNLLDDTVLPYYKLHGCIDYANTADGRIIIAQSDYRFYETHRRALFRRLERDLYSRCLVFIGYSFRDSNFQAILTDACSALDIASLPRSYALRKGFSESEKEYWLSRYNIHLLDVSADTFINLLEKTWNSLERSVLTPRQRYEKQLHQVDISTSLSVFGNAFYRLELGQVTGQSSPQKFFRGGEPTWPDIRDKIAPRRSSYWPLMEAIVPEMADPHAAPSAYLITGAAGTGKTTLAKTICFDLLAEYDDTLPIFLHIAGVPINIRDFASLVRPENPKRILVYFANASSDFEQIDIFYSECVRLNLPVTLLLEERKNQWLMHRPGRHSSLHPPEFELASLNDEEIEDILDALEKFHCLDALADKPRVTQTAHFKKLANLDLLVALRELTSESSFDEIIKDEFKRIPTVEGRAAYLYAAAFGQLDLALRYETLQHLLRINFSEFSSTVFIPTEGILITTELHGYSRHNFGFRIRVRHPIIASIIFALGAPDDETKFDIINKVISRLDPGFPEDKRILQAVIRRKELANTFSDSDMRRGLYERLATILPNDPYVLQHRAILERDLRNGQAAIKFARKALQAQPGNAAFKNTLGFALEFAARTASSPTLKSSLLREARALFEDGLRQNKRDAYSYLGIASLMKQNIHDEFDNSRRTVLKAELLSFLEEAYEATDQSNQIATELASVRASLGGINDAVEAIKHGLTLNPADTRLRDIWIEIELERNNLEGARSVAFDGIHNDPTSWRLHRSLARINIKLKEPFSVVSANYQAAVRHHKGDWRLLVEYASYVFMTGRYDAAKAIFQEASKSAHNGYEKGSLLASCRDDQGKERRFEGKVNSINGARASVLAIPENFEAFFWRTREDTARMQLGDSVKFTLAFNTYGPFAHIIRRTRKAATS